uniref:Uncharacterized protein n=1 Tax=Rhizophora mucronata TaxID=61149 RepID=A0A2P2M2T0_RHIMU
MLAVEKKKQVKRIYDFYLPPTPLSSLICLPCTAFGVLFWS